VHYFNFLIPHAPIILVLNNQKKFHLQTKKQRNNAQEVADAEFWASAFKNTISPHDDPMEPVTDLLYPVIDQMYMIRDRNGSDTTSNDNNNNNVVAMLASSFYWRDAMKNILPSSKQGLVVVISNPCSSSFTYLVK
jgi:hypothetical protein